MLFALCFSLVGIGFNQAYLDVKALPLRISASLIQFYKSEISPCGSPDCVFYPSCSLYSKEALERYGFFKGWAMSFDRITRCNHEDWIYPEIKVEGEVKKFDPVRKIF